MTFVWSWNTVRESSHISFFCGRVCEVVRRPENTHWGGTDRSAWVTSGSPPLAWASSRSLFSPKLQTLYCLFKSHTEIWTRLVVHIFSVYSWLSELTYFCFFPGNLLILSTNGNICHSIQWHPPLSVKPLCWCYIATALNVLSSSTLPAEILY